MNQPPEGYFAQIGNYYVGQTIGKGTFGKVKMGLHIFTMQNVAIKILDKDKIVDEADKVRVAREIQILRKIRHPNIIQLFEIIESQTQLFLITEYAQNSELFNYIVKRNRLSERQSAKFLLQILGAVEYLHANSIVHRDLKPENLLLDFSDSIKVVDFGLSNMYSDGETLSTACGSPCYAAPEMVSGKRYEGLKTDIWSSGIVLYAMICGFLPFEDQSTPNLYKKIINDPLKLPPFLSETAQSFLSGILHKDPQRRFTIPEMRAHDFCVKNTNQPILRGITYGKDEILVDPMILSLIKENFEVDIDAAKVMIQNNKHNQITATYYLLLNNHIRKGGVSVADLSRPIPVNKRPSQIIITNNTTAATPKPASTIKATIQDFDDTDVTVSPQQQKTLAKAVSPQRLEQPQGDSFVETGQIELDSPVKVAHDASKNSNNVQKSNRLENIKKVEIAAKSAIINLKSPISPNQKKPGEIHTRTVSQQQISAAATNTQDEQNPASDDADPSTQPKQATTPTTSASSPIKYKVPAVSRKMNRLSMDSLQLRTADALNLLASRNTPDPNGKSSTTTEIQPPVAVLVTRNNNAAVRSNSQSNKQTNNVVVKDDVSQPNQLETIATVANETSQIPTPPIANTISNNNNIYSNNLPVLQQSTNNNQRQSSVGSTKNSQQQQAQSRNFASMLSALTSNGQSNASRYSIDTSSKRIATETSKTPIIIMPAKRRVVTQDGLLLNANASMDAVISDPAAQSQMQQQNPSQQIQPLNSSLVSATNTKSTSSPKNNSLTSAAVQSILLKIHQKTKSSESFNSTNININGNNNSTSGYTLPRRFTGALQLKLAGSPANGAAAATGGTTNTQATLINSNHTLEAAESVNGNSKSPLLLRNARAPGNSQVQNALTESLLNQAQWKPTNQPQQSQQSTQQNAFFANNPNANQSIVATTANNVMNQSMPETALLNLVKSAHSTDRGTNGQLQFQQYTHEEATSVRKKLRQISQRSVGGITSTGFGSQIKIRMRKDGTPDNEKSIVSPTSPSDPISSLLTSSLRRTHMNMISSQNQPIPITTPLRSQIQLQQQLQSTRPTSSTRRFLNSGRDITPTSTSSTSSQSTVIPMSDQSSTGLKNHSMVYQHERNFGAEPANNGHTFTSVLNSSEQKRINLNSTLSTGIASKLRGGMTSMQESPLLFKKTSSNGSNPSIGQSSKYYLGGLKQHLITKDPLGNLTTNTNTTAISSFGETLKSAHQLESPLDSNVITRVKQANNNNSSSSSSSNSNSTNSFALGIKSPFQQTRVGGMNTSALIAELLSGGSDKSKQITSVGSGTATGQTTLNLSKYAVKKPVSKLLNNSGANSGISPLSISRKEQPGT